ncbi:MAG: aKG-HExxH-type peptide beta-hydroxylase [Nitrospiraceae bacterium]
MTLFDPAVLTSLLRTFRASMRDLLFDLCDELEGPCRRQAAALRVQPAFGRFVGGSLKLEDYSGWKVVGWIELLNDLVYFIDLREQLRRDRDPEAFAADLFVQCEEQFYENSYVEELFPRGEPPAAGLERRLSDLCVRLAQEWTQESLFLVPGLPCAWLAREGRRLWTIPGSLAPNFERAELGGRLYVGLAGAYLEPPAGLRRRLARHDRVTFLIRPNGIRMRTGRAIVPLVSMEPPPRAHWRYVPPTVIRGGNADGGGRLTLGEVLRYGRNRSPRAVVPPPAGLADRIRNALAVIEQAWPAGARNLATLTSRIIPLEARGVVSFSYRHRPGLSFINMFERDQLDLIDDLVHENSHHHLNLLLRKDRLLRGDRNQEIFYSPWRQSLRPPRGILHATFTFTMGAMLFERLSAREARLTQADQLRARYRCLEEIESVQYSIRDLLGPARARGWLTPAGLRLVRLLEREIAWVRRRIAPWRDAVMRSRYGPMLRRHIHRLEQARTTYGRTG